MKYEKDEKISIFSEFIQQVTKGVEGMEYKGKKIGSNIFLINYIGNNPKCQMKDISDYLGVNPSAATRRVGKLVKLDLVTRKTPENDRRVVLLSLTPQGKKLYSQFLKNRRLSMNKFSNMFSSNEIETFFTVLDQLIHLVPENLTLEDKNGI